LSPENPTIQYILRFKTPKGKIKYINTFSKGLFNYNGKLIKITGFNQDVTEEEINKRKSERLTENFSIIESFSKTFICEYENGKYTFTSEVYNILGIKVGDYPDNVNVVAEHIIPEDKHLWDNANKNLSPENSEFNITYRILTNSGDLLYILSYTKGLFNSEGELIRLVGILQDVTLETLAKKEAMVLKDDLETIQKTSKIVIAKFKNGVYSYTDEIYDILEIKKEDYPTDVDLIELFVLPDKKGDFNEQVEEISPSNPETYRISTVKTPTGKIKYLEGYLKAKFSKKGEFIELVGFIHEITNRIERERELEQLSEDRKILLQEVHHRVKNNLQLILSFLSIESRYSKDNPEYVLEQTRNRIKTMALTHEEIYKSQNVSSINLQDFLTTGIENLFNIYTLNTVKLNLDIIPVDVDIDTGIPLGLLTNEIALNTIKYAFPDDGKGNFYMNLVENEDNLILKVWDDGIGLPEGVDLFTSNSLGFMIIRNLSQQIEAKLSVLEEESGFGIKLIIPK